MTSNGTHPASLGDDWIASPAVRTVVAAAVLLVVVAALWAPFGVHSNPQGDGWILKERVASGERWIFKGNPTRAFLLVPWTVAHFLTPNSFVAVHILLIALLWGTALVLFEILRQLPGCNEGFAFLAASLSIVYPASTQWISPDEPLDRHWASFFFLLSVMLLLAYWRRPRPALVIVMFAAQIVSLWTNEAILPLALATPLALWWVAGGYSPRFRRVSTLWLFIPILNALHNIVHHAMVAMIPGSAIGRSRAVAVLAIDDGWRPMAASLVLAYRRHIADGWWQSAGMLDRHPGFVALATMTAMAVAITGFSLWPRKSRLDSRLLWFLAVTGWVAIGLGFAPFVVTFLRFTHGRSFIISSLGAVLLASALAALAAGWAGRQRTVCTVLIGLFCGLGAVWMLHHRARYVSGSRAQDTVFAAIIEHAPRVRSGTFFAIKMKTVPNALRGAAGFHRRDNILLHALRYLYGDSTLRAGVVDSTSRSAAGPSYRLDEEGVEGRRRPGDALPTIGWDQVLLFEVKPDLEVVLRRRLPKPVRGPAGETYRPLQIIDRKAPLPRRWKIVADDHEPGRISPGS